MIDQGTIVPLSCHELVGVFGRSRIIATVTAPIPLEATN